MIVHFPEAEKQRGRPRAPRAAACPEEPRLLFTGETWAGIFGASFAIVLFESLRRAVSGGGSMQGLGAISEETKSHLFKALVTGVGISVGALLVHQGAKAMGVLGEVIYPRGEE